MKLNLEWRQEQLRIWVINLDSTKDITILNQKHSILSVNKLPNSNKDSFSQKQVLRVKCKYNKNYCLFIEIC